MGLSTTYTKAETDFLIQQLEEKTSDKYNDESNSIANDIINFIDVNTGKDVNYIETTTWQDGSPMDDSKVDNIIYMKKEGKYYVRILGTNEIDASDFGVVNDINIDSSTAIQRAVDYAIAKKVNLRLPQNCAVSKSIYIDRPVDGANFSDYFVIKGGYINVIGDNITVFSTRLTNAISPQSQLINFNDLKFISNGDDNYAFDGNAFLRVIFNGISLNNVKFLQATKYVQSYYIDKLQARNWSGILFSAIAGTYDIHVTNSIIEAGETAFIIKGNNDHKAQFWIDNCVIEGLRGRGVVYSQSTQVSITNTYFELNTGSSIESENLDEIQFDVNVNIENNFFAGAGQPNTPDGYRHVIFGSILRGVLKGNVCGGNNLVYYKKANFANVFQEQNWGDETTNIVGKRARMFYGRIPNIHDFESVGSEFFIDKGSIVWNTEISDTNDWVGAICVTDKLDYKTSKWLKFGQSRVKTISLDGSENLNLLLETAVYFTKNALVGGRDASWGSINEIGVLEVIKDIDENKLNCLQRYTSNLKTYTRFYIGRDGYWSNWREL